MEKHPMKKKQKSVASVGEVGNIILGISDVIRYDDVMTVKGFDIKVSKAVELGIKLGLAIASDLKEDLQSETGLLITFPIAMLMDQLQRQIGTGEELLDLVKP